MSDSPLTLGGPASTRNRRAWAAHPDPGHAGDDVATTPEEYAALTAEFDRSGKTYEAHVYDGAPHSFFDASYEQWQEACTDAWHRILAFTSHR